MFTKRTDLAIEAHELWQESAGKTTRLAGVKATEKKIQGYPVTQVDILDREGEAALGKPAGSYRTLDLTAFWQSGDGFFDRAVRAVGQQVKELTPDSGPVLVVGLGNRAMTPDAVGPLAADSILITRHLIDAMPQHFSGFRPVAALRPGVLGTTAWNLQRRCGDWWTGSIRRWSSPWTRWPPAGWGGCAVPSSSATPASSPAAA